MRETPTTSTREYGAALSCRSSHSEETEARPAQPFSTSSAATADRTGRIALRGFNIGYQNPEFDRACRSARADILGSPQYQESHRLAQAIFADDLPAVPLYMRVNTAATRPDLCNFNPDPSARSDLWNLEELDVGEACE